MERRRTVHSNARGISLSGAGWYADPIGRYPQRYWDGSGWTASVLDAQNQVTVDYLGTPVDALPPYPAKRDSPRRGWRPSAGFWRGAGFGAVALAVLIAAIVISDRRARDQTDDAVAAQASDTSDQLDEAVSDFGDQLSDVESQVSELSDELTFDTEFFTEFTDFPEPDFEACDLLTPADVLTVLGVEVKVDRELSLEPWACALSTPATADGTAMLVFGDVLPEGDDLEDVLFDQAPGGFDSLTKVEVGDEGYVTNAYGLGFAAGALNDSYVVIQVQRGGGAPSPEQLTELLRIAISHM